MCGEGHDHHGKTLLVTSDGIGTEPGLRDLLMRSFLSTLAGSAEKVELIFLLNRGVLLAAESSEVLEELKKLDGAGVAIFSSAACLDHFNLRDRLKVGGVGDMASFVAALNDPANIVTIG